MATGTLRAADLAKLTQYADNNDSYDYWNLLASLGDDYAKLALQVVTGDSLFGYIANHYAASFAQGSAADSGRVWIGISRKGVV